jgi:DNA-binding transcriptional MerR regulator
MDKAPDAYRTISEVAEDLDLPQHVLRFWETRFSQIKPLKRGGGRRYYRPDDVELLKGIRHLLYKEGYTIKGVQRILKEQGVKAVQAFIRQSEAQPFAVVPESPPRPAAPVPPVQAYQPERFADEDMPPAPSSGNDAANDSPFEDAPVHGAPAQSRPAEFEPAQSRPADEIAIPAPAEPVPAAAPVAPRPPASPVPSNSHVSMFRGGVRQGENPAGSLGDFTNRIRERVDSAPPSDAGVPGTDGADLLRLALEDLIACRARIDQILSRRQA